MQIASEDIYKTTIRTRGSHAYAILPSSTFQCFIYEVTRGLEEVHAFIDDIPIGSKTHEDHIALFQHLEHYGVTLKPSKCTLGASTLTLGFHVSGKRHWNFALSS
ncbi:hypothetical protein CDAR_44481 [Caerostris darwini]|uniref:Reverse transcriptase domain-containing protein n=1 Tax=Caerostris darwini TaxID=1538125 RepID=A0AAV4QM60_9ARAC|nr:hypothetical protein CDAR_44481 [Caerostris darwini]